MIVILLLILLLMLWFTYETMEREIINPSFTFVLSFTFSSTIATLYSLKWNLNLHINTFCVLVGGAALYIFFSALIHLISTKHIVREDYKTIYEVDKIKSICLIIISIISIIWTIQFLKYNISESTLARIIYTYRYANVFTTDKIFMPKLLGYLRSIVTALGYFYAFLLGYKLAALKKFDIIYLVVIILSGVNASLTGGRQQMINIICATICAYILVLQKKNGSGKIITIKKLLKYFVIVFAVLWIFKSGGELIGRNNSNTTLMDYIAKYCGAQIKNLDLFLQTDNNHYETIWGMQTFYSFWSWKGVALPVRDLAFNYVNGFNLGNVYTTYFDYIYDFGYLGVIVLIPIMACIMQALYEKTRRSIIKPSTMFWFVLFGYEFPNVLFSFFSNEFYIYNLSSNFVQYVIVWILLLFLIYKIKIPKIVLNKKHIVVKVSEN